MGEGGHRRPHDVRSVDRSAQNREQVGGFVGLRGAGQGRLWMATRLLFGAVTVS